MNVSAEVVVRKFMDTWSRSDVDEIVAFFSDDAIYTDGPRGTYYGADAIKAELLSTLEVVPTTTADVKNLVVHGGLVMVERVDIFRDGGQDVRRRDLRGLRSQ